MGFPLLGNYHLNPPGDCILKLIYGDFCLRVGCGVAGLDFTAWVFMVGVPPRRLEIQI